MKCTIDGNVLSCVVDAIGRKTGVVPAASSPGTAVLDLSAKPFEDAHIVTALADGESCPFCDKVKQVACKPPETWAKYKADADGVNDIISMEYKELQKAYTDDDADDYEENLIHLAAACLHAWRVHHDAD